MKKELEMAIAKAEGIAKNGTQAQKESFVNWACESLRYLSEQGDTEGVALVKAQYEAYLKALTHTTVKFRWIENFDGGVASELFATQEEAHADMLKHVESIRWTKRELEKAKRNHANLVVLEQITLDCDGDEIDFCDVDSVEINEDTLYCVYD